MNGEVCACACVGSDAHIAHAVCNKLLRLPSGKIEKVERGNTAWEKNYNDTQRRTGAGGGRAFPLEFCVRQQYVSDRK